MNILGHYIDGRDLQDGVREVPIVDPANGKSVRRVMLAGVKQVDGHCQTNAAPPVRRW